MKLTAALLFMVCVLANGQEEPNKKEDILWRKLADRITEADRSFDGLLGVAMLDLKSNREWQLNGNEVFPTASTIKLAILAELFHQDQLASQGRANNASLNDTYVVKKEDLVPDSAVLGNLTPGRTTLTNRDLAAAVVVVSDNSASNILADRVGMARVNQTLDGLGLTHTRLRRQMMDLAAAKAGRENVATPHELVLLLKAIWGNKLFDAQRTNDFFALVKTPKESSMPRLLPETVSVANKPGALAGVRCDAGIIFVPNHPFALAVMTSYDRDEHEAQNIISRISLWTWRMFDVLAVSSEYGRQISERNSH